MEEFAWHVDSYEAELEGENAAKNPLTLEECASIAEECLTGRIKIESLCMGNIKEKEALDVARIIDSRFLESSRVLLDDEVPVFRSKKLPTKAEASLIFGPSVSSKAIPVVFEDLVCSESEENHSVEIMLQAGSDLELGYEGVSILELIGYMAYSSAFAQLRSKEQLGYIVSAFNRKTAGNVRGLGVVVQSSTTLPLDLERRCEAWIVQFRKELEEMSEDRIAMEASAVVAQILERDTKLSDEVSRFWYEISATNEFVGDLKNPDFGRLKRIADELTFKSEGDDKETGKSQHTVKEFKQKMLDFYDKHFVSTSPDRRAMSSRVYGIKARAEFEKNFGKPGRISTHAESLGLKQYLGSFPTVPYWSNKS